MEWLKQHLITVLLGVIITLLGVIGVGAYSHLEAQSKEKASKEEVRAMKEDVDEIKETSDALKNFLMRQEVMQEYYAKKHRADSIRAVKDSIRRAVR